MNGEYSMEGTLLLALTFGNQKCDYNYPPFNLFFISEHLNYINKPITLTLKCVMGHNNNKKQM